MSSNSNHNNGIITEANYEEFFVLYMDNELSAAEREMVDAFVAKRPALRAELELLLQTKLPADPVAMDKASLMADSMKLNDLGEELLLHLDNELEPVRAASLELQLASDQVLLQQWSLLQQTKLDASEKVIFANKEILYRHTVDRLAGIKIWWRIAAIVLVVLVMGVLYLITSSRHGSPSALAVHNAPQHAVNKPQGPTANGANASREDVAQLSPSRHHNNPVLPSRLSEPHSKVAPSAHDQTPVQPAVAVVGGKRQEAQPSPVRERLVPASSIEGAVARVDVNPTIIDKSPVTSALHDPFNSTEAGTQDPSDALADRDDRKGSLKGFLRKATRIIERRTGLGVASSDDESLLVGAVELKLK